MNKNTTKIIITIFLGCLFLSSCQTVPDNLLEFPPDYLATRQMQTRVYHTANDTKIIQASAGVVQDLGYNISESETKLGLIIATKNADALDKPMVALATATIFLNAFAGHQQTSNPYRGVSKEQKIRVSIFVKKHPQSKHLAVRVIFQRIVWDMEGNIMRQETIKKAEIYQQFFSKLSTSIFLEAHEI